MVHCKLKWHGFCGVIPNNRLWPWARRFPLGYIRLQRNQGHKKHDCHFDSGSSYGEQRFGDWYEQISNSTAKAVGTTESSGKGDAVKTELCARFYVPEVWYMKMI